MLREKINYFLQITGSKLQQMNYSKHTVNIYLHYLNEFLEKVGCSPSKLSNSDLEDYLVNYKYSSVSKQNQIISSLKFFWVRVLGRKRLRVDFKRPRKEKKLPKIIDQYSAIKKIKAIENKKHKAILWLALSTGMRVSEIINLKIKDIDSKRMVIHVKNAKGRKDRFLKLTDGTLKVLRRYVRDYRPDTMLFNGQNSKYYSTTSCNKIVKKYIAPDAHMHLLRHTFSCAVLENGTDVNILQNALGHARLETSAAYLHLTKNAIQRTQAPL